MLFFYAGHGNPDAVERVGRVRQPTPDVQLANITGGGNLRYYWQCSCEVFAPTVRKPAPRLQRSTMGARINSAEPPIRVADVLCLPALGAGADF